MAVRAPPHSMGYGQGQLGRGQGHWHAKGAASQALRMCRQAWDASTLPEMQGWRFAPFLAMSFCAYTEYHMSSTLLHGEPDYGSYEDVTIVSKACTFCSYSRCEYSP